PRALVVSVARAVAARSRLRRLARDAYGIGGCDQRSEAALDPRPPGVIGDDVHASTAASTDIGGRGGCSCNRRDGRCRANTDRAGGCWCEHVVDRDSAATGPAGLAAAARARCWSARSRMVDATAACAIHIEC